MEIRTARVPKLASEYTIYRALAGGVGIARVYWFGRAQKYNALVLDVLGPSLYDLFKFCGRKFTIKTVLMLADQLLARIKYIHENNFIHRDIKPANLVMGLDMQELNNVFFIDFGLAKGYRSPASGKHITYREHKSLTGTARFASVNTHLGIEQSRRDDLESLGFTLIYFALGGLPWQGIKATTREEFHYKIVQKKVNTSVEVLCSGLPAEFATYLHYCRALIFDETPEYNCLRRLFRKLFFSKGYAEDTLFDWTLLNMKHSTGDRRSIGRAKDTIPRDNSSKETKNSNKDGQGFDDNICITPKSPKKIDMLQVSSFV